MPKRRDKSKPSRPTAYTRLLKLIREQEAARAAAEAEERAELERQRRARRRERERGRLALAREVVEIDRLIMSQDRARRAAEAEEREEARRLERTGRWFERQGELAERRERRKIERAAAQVERKRKRQQELELDRWERQVDRERKVRGVTKRERAKAARVESKERAAAQAMPTVEAYIMSMMQEAHDCLKRLGFKVRDLAPWHYSDGSFDVQLTVDDPDDTNGSASLLKMEECVKPVIGAFIAVGCRHYQSGETNRRLDYANRTGKRVPGSLRFSEEGKFTNMTNYRPAGVSEIADHFNAWSKFLIDYAEMNRAYCAELFVRYHYSPTGKAPK